MRTIFDNPDMARKATAIAEGIMQSHSPRISEIARCIVGKEAANYKAIQRFLEVLDPQEVLLCLFQGQASFVIGDPTEMPHPQAKKNEYVGTLSDGETLGYWLLILVTPYHGRAIPCGFVDYSSNTINKEATSRNLHHFAAFSQVKALIGDRLLLLDREFSYLELLENLAIEGNNFASRLKVGPNFWDNEGNPVTLSNASGKKRSLNTVFYKGKVFVNVIGFWQAGFCAPIWIMTNRNAQEALAIYWQRMKIEQTFRDLKNLLNLHNLMNKHRNMVNKMIALMMIVYAVILFMGETLRAQLFPEKSCKNELYSGLFVILKLKPNLSAPIQKIALTAFSQIILPVQS